MQNATTTWGSKRRFILDHPDLSASQVISLAGELGTSITRAYVSMVRAEKNSKPAGAERPRSLAERIKAKDEPRLAAEKQLRVLFGELGLARSREIVADVARRFG